MNMRDIQSPGRPRVKSNARCANCCFQHSSRDSSNAFGIGDTVYLKNREERRPGMVLAIIKRSEGTLYEIGWAHVDGYGKEYYPFELTAEYEPNF